jgi:hypothetical protein
LISAHQKNLKIPKKLFEEQKIIFFVNALSNRKNKRGLETPFGIEVELAFRQNLNFFCFKLFF